MLCQPCVVVWALHGHWLPYLAIRESNKQLASQMQSVNLLAHAYHKDVNEAGWHSTVVALSAILVSPF